MTWAHWLGFGVGYLATGIVVVSLPMMDANEDGKFFVYTGLMVLFWPALVLSVAFVWVLHGAGLLVVNCRKLW